MKHAVRSLSQGFIGLDFGEDVGEDVGDLRFIDPEELPVGCRDYSDFARRMKIGDEVLVVVHHYPFALARVSSDYLYVTNRVPEIGVWFRHFRRVERVWYYSDHVTNPKQWKKLVMTDTISILNDPESKSYRLIADWVS
jgi:hypothetical protein